jgi:CRISPR-associated endonuclease/helicase Cas3
MPDSRPLAHGPAHPLVDHLHAVAALARTLHGHGLAPVLAPLAHLAGLWHDLGKFRPGFQRYVREDADAHVEGHAAASVRGRDKTHSAAGALHALQALTDRFGPGAAAAARVLVYVIAGHHAGLDNWHGGDGAGLDPRLFGGGRDEARREFDEALAECRRLAPTLLELPAGLDLRAACAAIPGLAEGKGQAEPLAVSLWIRMLFSALVDADFLDTEAYFDPSRRHRRAGFEPLTQYREMLDRCLHSMSEAVAVQGRAGDAVMQARAQVLAQCRAKAALPPGVFSLTVPTGGGKTLASLTFALNHAKAHGLRRVVVAIPYTSIVEQTADVFAGIFGREAVVEHHSQADADDDRRDSARSRLACENWDAPLVVTTNVQLLESLFARRSSRCRKLHNLAGSVIVLDEAQSLPAPFLQPILDALRLLVKHYGATLLLCTATQPVLTASERFDPRQRLRGLPPPRAIVDAPEALYATLDRVKIEWPADWHIESPVPELAARLAQHDCALAIVNTRADAADLVAALDAAVAERDGERTLHLSAAMCGQHRADVIAQIRQRLAARRDGHDTRPLRVVSTQIVEAGVDIDFPVVYRALAGLDSIAQAAGRCNREGLLGERGGSVVVFVRPIPVPLTALRAGAQATVSTLADGAPESLTPAHFTRYFPLYYANFGSRDQRGVVEHLRNNVDFAFDFRTAAEKFRLVDDEGQVSVVVRYRPPGEDVESPAEAPLRAIDAGQVDRWRLRALQRYIVNVRRSALTEAQRSGAVREALPGLFVLIDALRYDDRLGLLSQGQALDAATLVQ